MKNDSKVTVWCIQLVLALFIFVATPVGANVILQTPPQMALTCPGPNVWQSSQGSRSVSFAWFAVSGADSYRVYYYNKTTNEYSPTYNVGGANFTASNLEEGTYAFYFATVCDEEVSEFVIQDNVVIY